MKKIFLQEMVKFAKEIYDEDYIPLHRPIFEGNEKQYLSECIDSNFVSSVGLKVTEFEQNIAKYTGTKYAVATVNGTAALQVAIQLAGVSKGDEILTQPLTFIATCNAISYAGATPNFIDVDKDTMGMSPLSLELFLNKNCKKINNHVINQVTGKRVSSCVPMHTYGIPCRIKEIKEICDKWGIPLIEDAAESLGSYVANRHTGSFGIMGTLSFNGNKLITTGGGGMIITNDKTLALKAKHITTTSKVTHPYKFIHDEIGYNFRLPNLNAALGCAQLEKLDDFLIEKEIVAKKWNSFFKKFNIKLASSLPNNKQNNWLNTIILDSKKDRDLFLEYSNENGVMTRPAWELMSDLNMYKNCCNDGIKNSKWLRDRIVNIPSSVPNGTIIKLK